MRAKHATIATNGTAPLLDLTAVPQRELEGLRSGLLALAAVLKKQGV